jgi:hypothetical protein
MTWLVESPWPAVTLGVVLEVALAIVLLRTGRAAVLVAMAIVLVVTIGMLIVELAIVTEVEAIEDALEAASVALEANNPPQVLALFSPRSPRRGEVESALARFTVREANVGGDLEIRTNQLTQPPSANAYFTGRIEGRDNQGELLYENLVRKFKVTLHHDGDRWLLYDFAVEEPISGRWTSGRFRDR